MDPFTTEALAATLTALVGGAAGEVGKSTWTSLKSFVTARWGRESDPATALVAVEDAPHDPEAVHALAGTLHSAADRDPEAAAWLGGWLKQANATGTAHNTISGNAQVRTAIQGHQFTGDINIS